MYSSYFSSLGANQTTSVPNITPTPTNSPQCYFTPSAETETSSSTVVVSGFIPSLFNGNGTVPTGVGPETSAEESEICSILGNHVQLFYWDNQQSDNHTMYRSGSMPITAVHSVMGQPGLVTFTSPSVHYPHKLAPESHALTHVLGLLAA